MVAENTPVAPEETPKKVETPEAAPRVQMRAKSNGAAAKPPAVELPTVELPTVELLTAETPTIEPPAVELPAVKPPTENELPTVNDAAQSALQRAMGTLYESSPETEDNNEEIRRLDNQLDHLNDYISKVEERLNTHNAKLRETLKQQREDREKRRQSFHERLETNRQEDDEFQKQLNALLNQITLSRHQSAAQQSAD